jgi:hypothetical protein
LLGGENGGSFRRREDGIDLLRRVGYRERGVVGVEGVDDGLDFGAVVVGEGGEGARLRVGSDGLHLGLHVRRRTVVLGRGKRGDAQGERARKKRDRCEF